MPTVLNTGDAHFAAAFTAFLAKGRDEKNDVDSTVAGIPVGRATNMNLPG